MTVDARLARGGALAVWAVFFFALWLTGSTDRFLGTRTEWIVPFGAIVLALAVLAYGYGYLRATRRGPRLTLREATGLFALLVPLAAVTLVPHAALGSYAAARKGSGSFFLSARPPVPPKPANASFLDIRIAEGDHAFARSAGIVPGLHVRLLGFVTGSKDVPPGTFEIARFYISCCIADAQAVGVPIAGRAPKRDTWLVVSGSLARRGERFVVKPSKIQRVEAPAQPYLSFRT
jgi:uncharacterized repeat protein (TIGR03943 family)